MLPIPSLERGGNEFNVLQEIIAVGFSQRIAKQICMLPIPSLKRDGNELIGFDVLRKIVAVGFSQRIAKQLIPALAEI